jgi:hypothetical protein
VKDVVLIKTGLVELDPGPGNSQGIFNHFQNDTSTTRWMFKSHKIVNFPKQYLQLADLLLEQLV